MAGQGDGLLQPTKLVQNDDFMDSIALPGYASSDLQALAANTALGAAGTIFWGESSICRLYVTGHCTPIIPCRQSQKHRQTGFLL